MVNRRIVESNHIIFPTAWGSEVANVLNDPTPVPVKLTIKNDYNDVTRLLRTDVDMEFFTSLEGSHKLCVFMVEDSIVDWQKDYDVQPNDIQFYTHREVFRGSMNGTYGEEVSNTAEGNSSTLDYSFTLPATWNEQQVSIITFLYREDTMEILQVEQRHIHE